MAYFKNRKTTGDLDYILNPEWRKDDIRRPIREPIGEVAEKHKYAYDWANDHVSLFVRAEAQEKLTRDAIEQNIVLWSGENIRVLAAPIEWALETKLRRMHTRGGRYQKAESDMSDAMMLLNILRGKKGGKLDMGYYRTLNANGFDPVPDERTLLRVAAAYKEKYNEDIFS